MRWFSTSPQPSTLDQDFITRYWDLVGRVDKMETHLDDIMDEIERRYKRAEQSERRLDEKRAKDTPWPDEEQPPVRRYGVYDIARRVLESQRAESNSPSG